MKTIFRCGHIYDDGIADGKTKQDNRFCLDCTEDEIRVQDFGFGGDPYE